jgi:hypothetical protein
MKKIAAITMARNDDFYLRKWVAYYGAQLGKENLYIFLDGLDQVDRRPRQQICPACIRTICTWVNDLLNERIADLM